MAEAETTYLEFGDSDDVNSNAYVDKSEERTSFRIHVDPQMFLLALIKEPKELHGDVLPAVRRLLDVAYEQGKAVGRQVAEGREEIR